jgi:cell division protease FtsH
MVGRWGMSARIGNVSVIPMAGQGPLLPGVADVSPHTHEVVDEEVHRIVEESYTDVLSVLRENRRRLDSLAAALLEHETLDEADAYAAAGIDRPGGAGGAYAAAARAVSP